MELYALIAFSVVTLASSTVQELTLPVTTCKRNSNGYDSCLRDAMQEAWPRFVPGLAEFNFSALDPLTSEFQKGVFDNGQAYGEIIARNIIMEGLRKTNILTAKTRLVGDVFKLRVGLHVPKVFFSADCEAEGNVGGMRMGGKGHMNGTIEDIKSRWDITGPVVNDRWIVEHFHVFPVIGKVKMSFKDLFDGNQDLNDLASIFVNEYWPMLYRMALPIAQKAWDPWLSEWTNQLFSKVSFSKTFP